MLHLFGAEDLYVPYLAAGEDKRIEAYCPGELMRYVPTDIQETSLSPYTMFRIGWRNRLDRQFAAFCGLNSESKNGCAPRPNGG